MKKSFIVSALIIALMTLFVCGCDTGGESAVPKKTSAGIVTPEGLKHRFVFISDTHISESGENDAVFTAIMEQIKKLDTQPEYIIVGGDILEGIKKDSKFEERLDTVKQKFSQYYPMDRILPLFGNHEQKCKNDDDAHELIFSQMFGEFQPDDMLDGYNKSVYYKDVDNIRLIALNAFHTGEENMITGSQLEWFKGAASTDKRKLVFVHSPAYPTGTQYNNSLDANPAERNEFWTAVDEAGAAAVLSGHEHNYSRRTVDSKIDPAYKNSIVQIINGTAGKLSNNTLEDGRGVDVAPRLVSCFSVIDVTDDAVCIKAISSTGSVVDEVTVG